ncbi:MAG: hypothetical protein Q9175_005828 [Cornicularia normoerica]
MDPTEQDHYDKARFATILQNLNRDNIPSLASAVRYSGHPSTRIIDAPTTPRPVSCRLLSRITCGSYNAVSTVLFADGTLWGISQAMRKQIRVRSLHGIAEAMAQLNSLSFSQGGSRLFDAKGDVVGVGASNIVDLDWWQSM